MTLKFPITLGSYFLSSQPAKFHIYYILKKLFSKGFQYLLYVQIHITIGQFFFLLFIYFQEANSLTEVFI